MDEEEEPSTHAANKVQVNFFMSSIIFLMSFIFPDSDKLSYSNE